MQKSQSLKAMTHKILVSIGDHLPSPNTKDFVYCYWCVPLLTNVWPNVSATIDKY